eukprot:3027390-Pleurochrysis_carterae.AAC.1
MTSGEDAGTPDERQRNLASLKSDLTGELSRLLHAAAIGGAYNDDRMIAIDIAIKREMTQQ